jgi:hypothetical protein
MTHDKTAKIRSAATEKSLAAISLAKNTIDEMYNRGDIITFQSVAEESGLSKLFLYKNEEVKSYLEQYKSKKYNNQIIDSLKQRYNNYKDRCLFLEAQNRKLKRKLRESQFNECQMIERENMQLRSEIYDLGKISKLAS